MERTGTGKKDRVLKSTLHFYFCRGRAAAAACLVFGEGQGSLHAFCLMRTAILCPSGFKAGNTFVPFIPAPPVLSLFLHHPRSHYRGRQGNPAAPFPSADTTNLGYVQQEGLFLAPSLPTRSGVPHPLGPILQPCLSQHECYVNPTWATNAHSHSCLSALSAAARCTDRGEHGFISLPEHTHQMILQSPV